MAQTAKQKNGKGGQRVRAIRGFLRGLGIAPDANAKAIDGARYALHEQFGTSRNLSRIVIRAKIADALGNGHNGNGRVH